MVLASEPVGGRSRATELPCLVSVADVTRTPYYNKNS